MSNFLKLLSKFKQNFPQEYKDRVDFIEKFVVNYIQKNNFNVKFLNACPGFLGLRTRNQIIICSPMNMITIGDFLYTIFHEIRHEQQVRDIKMDNPLSDYDLDDFEKLFAQYWEMELDADQFAKNKIANLIIRLKIPLDFARRQFGLSPYVENYPSMSQGVRMQLSTIIQELRNLKRSGLPFDIEDHPIIKKHIEKLESFI